MKASKVYQQATENKNQLFIPTFENLIEIINEESINNRGTSISLYIEKDSFDKSLFKKFINLGYDIGIVTRYNKFDILKIDWSNPKFKGKILTEDEIYSFSVYSGD